MAKEIAKRKTFYDKADKKLQRISATIGAIIAIVGALTGALSWLQSQFANAVTAQISGFQQEVRDADTRHEQAVTRVELMMLMEHDPENVVAIEQMAKHYFDELKGDKYMTGKYSAWARQYGGDMAIVIGVD